MVGVCPFASGTAEARGYQPMRPALPVPGTRVSSPAVAQYWVCTQTQYRHCAGHFVNTDKNGHALSKSVLNPVKTNWNVGGLTQRPTPKQQQALDEPLAAGRASTGHRQPLARSLRRADLIRTGESIAFIAAIPGAGPEAIPRVHHGGLAPR